MKLTTMFIGTLVLSTAMLAMPSTSYSQGTSRDRSSQAHRKSKQEEWKKIGIGSAAAAVLGLISKNGTLTTLGTVGALYSAYRYEEDRKSSVRSRREKAQLYSRKSVVIDGHRYKRQTVRKGKKVYYQFVRAS
ncbi:MAG: hypothetical protein JNM34_02895 [Chthonomonadaceae bacterium]|nr:hypothetical protein [Chthonomonadaceae bacterium]